MALKLATDSILTGWREEHTRLFDEQNIVVSHCLGETALFGEEILAALIDNYPKDACNIVTSADCGLAFDWRSGEIGALSGKQVFDVLKKGRFVLTLSNLHTHHSDYAALLDQLTKELSARVASFSVSKEDMMLSISSPLMRFPYKVDTSNTVRWQISGAKRLWVYPETPTFLSPDDLEKIVVQRSKDNLPYEPWFDTYAQNFNLTAGDMVHWHLYKPYRMENLDSLNIELVTRHETREVSRLKTVTYANGILRQTFGTSGLSKKTDGFGYYVKTALGLMHQRLRHDEPQKAKEPPRFRLDIKNPQGMVDLPQEDKAA